APADGGAGPADLLRRFQPRPARAAHRPPRHGVATGAAEQIPRDGPELVVQLTEIGLPGCHGHRSFTTISGRSMSFTAVGPRSRRGRTVRRHAAPAPAAAPSRVRR